MVPPTKILVYCTTKLGVLHSVLLSKHNETQISALPSHSLFSKLEIDTLSLLLDESELFQAAENNLSLHWLETE